MNEMEPIGEEVRVTPCSLFWLKNQPDLHLEPKLQGGLCGRRHVGMCPSSESEHTGSSQCFTGHQTVSTPIIWPLKTLRSVCVCEQVEFKGRVSEEGV